MKPKTWEEFYELSNGVAELVLIDKEGYESILRESREEWLEAFDADSLLPPNERKMIFTISDLIAAIQRDAANAALRGAANIRIFNNSADHSHNCMCTECDYRRRILSLINK